MVQYVASWVVVIKAARHINVGSDDGRALVQAVGGTARAGIKKLACGTGSMLL